MASAQTVTTLVEFDKRNGAWPGEGYLLQGFNGNLYGATTYLGYSNASAGYGTLFEMTPGGALKTLHVFEGTDGSMPNSALVQTANNFGSIFEVSSGLGPFVTTQPTSGPPGQAVYILGTDLTGATAVSFNGRAATFKVVSGSDRVRSSHGCPDGYRIGDHAECNAAEQSGLRRQMT